MAHAIDSCYVISVDYSSGSKFATVKRELHFQCTEPKDENGDGAGQPFSTGPHDQGRRLLDDLKLPPTLTGGVVCEKSNTISTSIGRKLLRTFPRRFGKVQWINLKKEAQFRCFLGYQRQLFGGVTKLENVGISTVALLGFQIATAPNMPMIVNRVSIEPHVSSGAIPPLQVTPTVLDPSAKETEDTSSPKAVELSLPLPHPRSETINESQSSPALKAWFHDFNLDPSGIPPGPFRSQQIARKKKETNEMLGNIDQLLSSSLENLNLNEGCPKIETLGTGFHQASPGSHNQSGSGGKDSSNPGNPSVTPNSNNGPGQGNKKRTRGGSDGGDEGHPEKPPRKKSGPAAGGEAKVSCTYYENETDREAREGHKCKKLLFTNHNDLCKHIQGVHLKLWQCLNCFTRYGRVSELSRHAKKCGPPEIVKGDVREFGRKVSSSTRDTIRDILYVNGKKQYDYLDHTNELGSSQDAAPEEADEGEGEDEDEDEDEDEGEQISVGLMKTLSPGHPRSPLQRDSRASHRDPKVSMSRNGEKALALFVQELKLAEQSDNETAVEQLVQQFLGGLPPTARLVFRYALKKRKRAAPLDKSVVGDTHPRTQPPSNDGYDQWNMGSGNPSNMFEIRHDYSTQTTVENSTSLAMFGSDSGIAPSQLGDHRPDSLNPSELTQQGLDDEYGIDSPAIPGYVW